MKQLQHYKIAQREQIDFHIQGHLVQVNLTCGGCNSSRKITTKQS